MPSKHETEVSFDQMKGAVGSLLFLWSGIERELTRSIDCLCHDKGQKRPHGIARSFDCWCDAVLQKVDDWKLAKDLCVDLIGLLRNALTVRNLVCHGLIGVSAQSSPAHGEAFLTVEMGDEIRQLSWSELQAMFSWMSRSQRLIPDLTDAALAPDKRQAEKRLHGWVGFPNEIRRT